MSTPDHHPYLTEGCLRTPEDVADWLDARVEDYRYGRAMMAPSSSFGPRVYAIDAQLDALACASRDLRAHLARERRQACRRAALENWRNFAQYARWCKERGVVPKDENEAMVLRVLAKTIAFRAAARQP